MKDQEEISSVFISTHEKSLTFRFSYVCLKGTELMNVTTELPDSEEDSMGKQVSGFLLPQD